MILENASLDLAGYNRIGLHYNLAANAIYAARRKLDPFSDEYLPYIVAGLIAFDMGRMMGTGGAARYDPAGNGFGAWLRTSIYNAKDSLYRLIGSSLHDIELREHARAIERAYDVFALAGPASGKDFHVGTTKILHWIVPQLFIMVDQNVARAFRQCHKVTYKKSTQPGYDAAKYIRCLTCAQSEITTYGAERLRSLEAGTPVARIFDKVAFIVGARLPGE